MSGLFGNVFRRIFWESNNKSYLHQCPTRQTVELPPPGGYKIYKRIALLVAIPIVLTLNVLTYLKKKSCPEERAPFAKYEYMRRRTKRFPWGDGNHSLFHNKKLNALPDGYEEDEEDC